MNEFKEFSENELENDIRENKEIIDNIDNKDNEEKEDVLVKEDSIDDASDVSIEEAKKEEKNDNDEKIETKSKKENKNVKRIIITILIVLILLINAIFLGHYIFLSLFGTKEKAVIDTVVPSFRDISIYSDNENDKNYAEVGDVITLKFMADEKLKNNPKVEINSSLVDVTFKDGYYYANYDVVEQYDKDFLMAFKISDYEDRNGNKGNEIFNTTDESFVYISAIDKIIEKVYVNSVKFETDSIYMTLGEKRKIDLIVEPSNATYDELKWESEDEKIVSVNNGEFVANNLGKTKVFAMVDHHGAGIEVNVVDKITKVTGIKFKNNTDTITVGESLDLQVELSPKNATNTKIKWSSSDENIATVYDGKVLAKKKGEVTITAKIDGVKTERKFVVKDKKNELLKIQLNTVYSNIFVGDKLQLVATAYPVGYAVDGIKWSSSNTNVATVSSTGLVVSKRNGEAVITASLDGKIAKATIIVNNKNVSVTGVSVTPTSTSLNVGASVTLNANITPNNASNKNVTWTSSDSTIASVSSKGVVTGKKRGTVVITVKTNDGNMTAKITIKVLQPVTQVTLNSKIGTKYLNETDKTILLKATISPIDADDKRLTWSSSNPDIAKVDTKGKVTALLPGQATITVKASSGVKATFTINVRQKKIIVVGSSHVGQMSQHYSQYSKKGSTLTYKVSDGSLKYIVGEDSGMAFQTGSGYNSLVSEFEKTKPYANYVENYVYFQMSKEYVYNLKTCTPTIDTINSNFKTLINKMNDSKQKYQVSYYVVSIPPVKNANDDEEDNVTIVVNSNNNPCGSSRLSNRKIYGYNKIVGSLNNNVFTYIDLFNYFVDVEDDELDEEFDFKNNYNTTNGWLWDVTTTANFTKAMFDKTKALGTVSY